MSHVLAVMSPTWMRPVATFVRVVRAEHLMSDKALHVYRHLQLHRACHDSYSTEYFTILDSAT